jgi:hypothetical protein
MWNMWARIIHGCGTGGSNDGAGEIHQGFPRMFKRETDMRQAMNRRFTAMLTAALVLCAAALIAACVNPGGDDLFFTPSPPNKSPPKNKRLVRAAHYVDSARTDAEEVLASTARYTLEGTDTYYFDYVIISGAEIKQGEKFGYFTMSGDLMKILDNRKNTIKPLRDKGIKVLLGISGGGDGISFGTLNIAVKDQEGSEQEMFALQLADTVKFYGLSGVEFNDAGGANAVRSPYPQMGGQYWDGQRPVDIPSGGEGEIIHTDAWKSGGNKFTDMMSYLIEALGASTSFQGDIDPDAVQNTPVLVRESGFGRCLPPAVPRYAFATTLGVLTYTVNADPAVFGSNADVQDMQDIDGDGDRDEVIPSWSSYNSFVQDKDYAPAILDLAVIDDDTLAEYSKRLGRNNYRSASYDEAKDYQNAPYGLVYYTNLGLPSSGMAEKLSVTSREVFGKAVALRN